MHTRTAAVVLFAACALAAGCSSSGGHDDKATAAPSATTASGPSPAADPQRAALEAAVRAYSAAFFTPDAAAGYALLSTSCKADTSRAAYGAELAAAVKTYGHQQIKTLSVDQIAGGLARVSYTYSVPALDQHRQPWALEGGAWKYDGC